MADLDDALLARMQKDLSGYTELYQQRLDKAISGSTKDLYPMWQKLASDIEAKVKALYTKAGAIQDPTKLKTYNNKIRELQALYASINNDIKSATDKQQPYFTETLKNQYEDSYYFNAFGLEQAGQVSVNVPLLTPARVLGVLVNPWLSDGANYAKRLSTNMAVFAKNIHDSIEKAVMTGQGWNTTAHDIKAKTNESYFNAVRLARTEMTRAAAQGANNLYMENADVLDGKRWNATKDSRTAPKDAANDRQTFDLDYDTPEKPGRAGQRIPNHPNCRCIWSPVLSALGVQEHGNIARGEGDTPTSWGKNYYTKAPNYSAYANERGLPDVSERLKVDNPTKYLRPGETPTALRKRVVKWTYKGNDIIISKPDWNSIKANAVNNGILDKKIATEYVGLDKSLANTINIEGMDRGIAQTVNEQLLELTDKFPAMKGKIDKIITYNGDEMQGAATYDQDLNAMRFNNFIFGRADGDSVLHGYQNGYVYKPNIRGAVTHEFGHAAYATLLTEKEQQTMRIALTKLVAKNKKEMISGLSYYSTAHAQGMEMIAEMFVAKVDGVTFTGHLAKIDKTLKPLWDKLGLK